MLLYGDVKLKSCYFVSSQQDRLRLTRLKTELSDSVQRYGDLQKVAFLYLSTK